MARSSRCLKNAFLEAAQFGDHYEGGCIYIDPPRKMPMARGTSKRPSRSSGGSGSGTSKSNEWWRSMHGWAMWARQWAQRASSMSSLAFYAFLIH